MGKKNGKWQARKRPDEIVDESRHYAAGITILHLNLLQSAISLAETGKPDIEVYQPTKS
jgi:hypothetical protein